MRGGLVLGREGGLGLAVVVLVCFGLGVAAAADAGGADGVREHERQHVREGVREGESGAAAAAFRLGPPLPARPTRVASLAPSLTEIVVALGAADRLVAVTRFCTDPAVAGVKRVGGYVDPSLEAVLGTRPDLVLVEPSPGNRDVVARLAELGVPVRVVPLGGLAEVRAGIRTVAADLDLAGDADALLRAFDAELRAVRRQAEARPPVRVAIVYGIEPLVLAGPGSFGDEILALVGGVNVAADAGTAYPQYPLERLVAAAPDVLVETFMDGRAGTTGLPGLTGVRRVRVGDDLLLRAGPRLPVAARRLFEAIHGDGAAERRMPEAVDGDGAEAAERPSP